jgi:hypothetical protein
LAPTKRGTADNSPASSSPPSGYLGDAPVDDPDADRLRRRPFAYRIADTITSRTDLTSVVRQVHRHAGQFSAEGFNMDITGEMRQNTAP